MDLSAEASHARRQRAALSSRAVNVRRAPREKTPREIARKKYEKKNLRGQLNNSRLN
jgi:hypothetical protein